MGFSSDLIEWYRINHRTLPWRETRDPYQIWVSEVILQQTRVDQGLSYYRAFLEKFPDVSALANATEQEVLRAWQGLGYYSRARNMHQAAQFITTHYGGKFPGSYKELMALKGVGDYTASAVASIAFDLSHPVVDGNVMRFISRLKGVTEAVDSQKGKAVIRKALEQEIDRENPGLFNQAVMEFGALVCTPRNPSCGDCPFRWNCVAWNTGNVDKFPVKEKKQSQKARYFHYLVHVLLEDNQVFTFINQRKGNDIWKNMFEFPMIEENKVLEWEEVLGHPMFNRHWYGTEHVLLKEPGTFRHILSHRVIFARYFIMTGTRVPDGFTRVKFSDLDNYPLPRLIEKIAEKANITFSSLKD